MMYIGGSGTLRVRGTVANLTMIERMVESYTVSWGRHALISFELCVGSVIGNTCTIPSGVGIRMNEPA